MRSDYVSRGADATAQAEYDREQRALDLKDKFLRGGWEEHGQDPYYTDFTSAEMKGTKISVACIKDEHGVDTWYDKVGVEEFPVPEDNLVVFYVVEAVDAEGMPGRCEWVTVRSSTGVKGNEEVAA